MQASMEPDVGGRFIPSFVYKGYKRNLSLGRPPRGRGLNLVKESSSEILVKDSQIRLQFVSVLPSSLSKVVLLSSLENEIDGLW